MVTCFQGNAAFRNVNIHSSRNEWRQERKRPIDILLVALVSSYPPQIRHQAPFLTPSATLTTLVSPVWKADYNFPFSAKNSIEFIWNFAIQLSFFMPVEFCLEIILWNRSLWLSPEIRNKSLRIQRVFHNQHSIYHNLSQ